MFNNNQSLLNISPLDGRYVNKVQELQEFSSEFALIKYRVYVEIKWLEALANNAQITGIENSDELTKLSNRLTAKFTLDDATQIKEIEKTTNHDVKAVEYFIAGQIANHPKLIKLKNFVHFACTSEDINNLAYSLMLKQISQILIQQIEEIQTLLVNMANQHKEVAMLSRTHGQVASPTTLGKEIANLSFRIQRQLQQIKKISILGKINGAVGNYNAHIAAYPNINWEEFSYEFIKSLELEPNPFTTQIEPHDYIAEIFDAYKRTNTIFIDLARDIWGYISIGYFTQKLKTGEIGSSTMPHKVNPIDFENAEGNLGIANALLGHLSNKLPISRWQRDLTDSTVMRNLGVSCGYSLLAYKSLITGLNKLQVNAEAMQADLNENWAVLAEAVQTIMRKNDIANPYEKLKTLTRGKNLTAIEYQNFVQDLDIAQDDKEYLLQLTPDGYIGLARKQTNQINEFI